MEHKFSEYDAAYRRSENSALVAYVFLRNLL